MTGRGTGRRLSLAQPTEEQLELLTELRRIVKESEGP
jgi:hypothetical protein